MSKINYAELAEITVKSQEELEMIPDDFTGRIFIQFGTCWSPAIVKKSYVGSVVARESSHVVAWESSHVVARESSHVVAWGNSSVEARESSHVVAFGDSFVVAFGDSFVEARESSHVEAWGDSSVVARESSHVVAWGNSSVEARESSNVEAFGDSFVEADGNSQITNFQPTEARIQISGNSRIVYNPKTIEEYVSFYGIKHNKKTGHFFKAVRRSEDGTLYSDYNASFRYVVGETAREVCDPDVTEECSYGIHISHLDWALGFGSDWSNLAIIEVETDLDKVVVPFAGNGKVRTSEVKVLREVPLEECGVFGQILARRLNQK